MPAARGVKRTASKASAAATSSAPKSKKKRNVVQLEVPTLPRRRGRVLTCGQGDVGQLGLGEDVIETTKFKFVTGLGDKIVDACAGGMHTIAIDSDGKVWTFGCNDEGALGRATSGETDEGTPKPVALPRPAVLVTAGDSHSAALLNNGDVYAWGSFRDSHGSMGLVVRGREGKPCKEPVRVDVGEPACALASGSDHLVILSISGNVYTMGCGEQGQLGRLSQRSASRETRQGFSALLVPAKVTLKQGASRVWAGYHATFILDNNDRMLAWGLNNYGQLGITGSKRKTALYAPLECDAFKAGGGWRAVAPGQHHTLALDGGGRVHALGRPEYGRLGLGDRKSDAETLEPIPKLQNKNCISIAAGISNSFAVTDSGLVFAWGMGSEGQLGTGACSDAAEPAPAALPAAASAARPQRVAAGGQHTVLLTEDPNAQKEPTPVPEKETEEQKTEEKMEEDTEPEPEKKPKGRINKRQKKQEQQQEEVTSSTSNAQPEETTEQTAPQKVNGDEKKETPMEVDETDSKQETPEEKPTENPEPTPQTQTEPVTETIKEAEPENKHKQDIDMRDVKDKPSEADEPTLERKDVTTAAIDVKTDNDVKEVNGTPDEKIEQKTVESLQAEQAITTSA